MRILVIDDEQDIRQVTQLLLEHFGHEVRTAKNGALGVECASTWLPDVVITDLAMPHMDGFLAARKLRSLSDSRRMLIIACSAHVQDAPTRHLALAAGCDETLTKPIDWDRLQSLLSTFEQTIDEDQAA